MVIGLLLLSPWRIDCATARPVAMVPPQVRAKTNFPDGTAMGSPSECAKTCTDRKRIHNSPSPPTTRKNLECFREKPSKRSRRSRNQLNGVTPSSKNGSLLPPALPSPDDENGVENIVRELQEKIEKLVAKNSLIHSGCPPFEVSMSEGKGLALSFRMPSTIYVQKLIAKVMARFVQIVQSDILNSRMFMRSSSCSPWSFSMSKQRKEEIYHWKEAREKNNYVENFTVAFSEYAREITKIEFVKQGRFSCEDVEIVMSALDIASTAIKSNAEFFKAMGPGSSVKTMDEILKTVDSLKSIGVRVCEPIETCTVPTSEGGISWDNLAGYKRQKRKIEDTIVLALRSPEVYDTIARETRTTFEPNRPRAVLFEGPPGTGKTSSARVIANQAGVPLLYVPLEVVLSKYFGESERLLGNVFSLANKLPSGALIFLDEVDSLASDRDNMINDASRGILSVLLSQIDGFEQDKKLMVIAATNRKEDLDPALTSRFDSTITFGLPGIKTRKKIVSYYAKHLTKSELSQLAAVTQEMSGRDIKDFCQQAERQWASKIIRGADGLKLGDLPPVDEYFGCAKERREAMTEVAIKRDATRKWKKRQR